MAFEIKQRRPVARVIGAFLLPALVVRIILVAELDLSVRFGDFRGVALDLAVSLLLVMVALVLLRFKRWGRIGASALAAFWCLINLANFEHIRELGAMVGLSYTGFVADPTFLFGSGLASSHPVVFSLILIVCVLALWAPHHESLSRKSSLWFIVPVVVFGAFALVPLDHRLAEWRQTNVVAAQAGRLGETSAGQSNSHEALPRNLQADLSGDSVISDTPRASNILLIILEGVSGAFLPTLRDRHGATGSITMPRLDRIAQSGLSWSTFINHQRQTNRGEYAILCGDYPKLARGGEPKMTEFVGKGPLDCLPAILREHGYATAYLQAAPMSFMLKDQFMPQSGFEIAIGDSFFQTPYHRNHWGVDDRTFFEQTITMVSELRSEKRPWFLTLMTVGTHHPFNAPPEFQSTYEHGSDGWAMDYLDHAIGAFIQDLADLGYLEDTLILITSDESREDKPNESDEASMLSQSWGFLIALTPTGDSRVIDEPFMQLDLPISILDYLDLADPAGSLGGRSVFRRYSSARDLFWGNTYLDLVGGLSSNGELVLCDGVFRTCRGTMLEGASLYSPDIELDSLDSSSVAWLERRVEETRSTAVATADDREFLFIPPGSTPVMADASGQLLFGGQFLTIPADSRANVDVEIELVGPAGGALNFSHDLVIHDKQQYLRTGRLEVGQRVIIRYSVATHSAFEGVHFRFWVEQFNTAGLVVVTKNASIRLSSRESTEIPPGLTEHLFQISSIAE